MRDVLTPMAYWIMRRAIERDPKSEWAKEATDQWLRYCEQQLKQERDRLSR